MSKAEAFEVNFGENKSIGVNVNFSKGDAIQVPVNINSLDAEKVGKEVGDRIAEKLDETALASVAKERTLLVESQTIQDAVRNIDLSSIEDKIDNIKLPEIDTSAIAKQGENQEATNTAIYALISQFGESVLQEKVTVMLNCQENIVWQDYAVNITFEDGRTQAVPLSENGTCSFNIKIGQNYSVQLPVIGTFIAPTLKTYTAISSSRDIYWSYVLSGVFGMDELGRRYSITQIEALTDKSIIKYGGFTTDYLENSPRDDGGSGNGFMWELDNSRSLTQLAWASKDIEFSQELLPFLTSDSMARPYCNGEAYTRYIISEGIRLGVTTPAATWCDNNVININEQSIHGYLPAFGQIIRLTDNYTTFKLLYQTLGLETPPFLSTNYAMATSCQSSAASIVRCDTGKYYTGLGKTLANYRIFCIFDLPK